MAKKPDIDFARAATLMDVVQKVASVAPAYMALSSLAMMELKEMNEASQKHITELGRERLAEEQKAAAELAEHNRKAAEEQAKTDAEIAARTEASRSQPPSIMPGHPVPPAVQVAVGDVPAPPEDQNMDGIADQQQGNFDHVPHDDTTVTRRV